MAGKCSSGLYADYRSQSKGKSTTCCDNSCWKVQSQWKFYPCVDGPNGEDRNSVIIDSLMNMSLLHWAYEETKDARFQAIAIMHTDTVAKYFVREDGSVRHIVRFNSDTGEVMDEPGGQGYGPGSAWSRGQSWAVYGFVMHISTRKKWNIWIKPKRSQIILQAI